MFLEYGVNSGGGLTHISEAGRGRSDLTCPYCGRALLARKGERLVHHFAHAGDTCREVAEHADDALRLPAYDRFNLDLSGKELAALQRVRTFDGIDGATFNRLKTRGYVEYNEWAKETELTPMGKIPLGLATLAKFAEVQQRLIRERYAGLVSAVVDALTARSAHGWQRGAAMNALAQDDPAGLDHLQEFLEPNLDALRSAFVDLNIYRAQLRRVLLASLYFVEITHDGGILYKVGVTNRELDQRIAEIRADLQPHLGAVAIKPLRVLAHRGGAELYFKHRYHGSQHRLGTLTEYFAFTDRKAVL